MVRDRLEVSVLTLSVFDQINHLLHLLMISIVLYFVNYRRWILICLKFVSAIFYQIFIFSPKDSTLKTMKNVFCFIWKALFVLEIFKVLYFRLPLFPPCQPLLKRGWSKINHKAYDVINCLTKKLIPHFVWYFENKKWYDIETLSIEY